MKECTLPPVKTRNMNAPQAPILPKRPTVNGKFFRVGEKKFYLKGLTYGPFRPGPDGRPFPNAQDVQRDFELIRRLGANFLRVYNVPPRWLLDLADQYGLKLL